MLGLTIWVDKFYGILGILIWDIFGPFWCIEFLFLSLLFDAVDSDSFFERYDEYLLKKKFNKSIVDC